MRQCRRGFGLISGNWKRRRGRWFGLFRRDGVIVDEAARSGTGISALWCYRFGLVSFPYILVRGVPRRLHCGFKECYQTVASLCCRVDCL